jgi:hypothetical protein
MTEKDWLDCEDSLPMLLHLGKKASSRKLRLFAVACCRDLFHLLADERNRQAVEVAERYADRQAKRTGLRNAEQTSREKDIDIVVKVVRYLAEHSDFDPSVPWEKSTD